MFEALFIISILAAIMVMEVSRKYGE